MLPTSCLLGLNALSVVDGCLRLPARIRRRQHYRLTTNEPTTEGTNMATGKISMESITHLAKSRATLIVHEPGPDAIARIQPLTTLAEIRDRLREMSVQDKIEWARHVSTQLELHMDLFPQSPVLYGDLHAFADDLQARFNETQIGLGHWKMLASFEAHQEALVDKALTRVAQYVHGVSRGDETMIDLAGMGAGHPGTPAQVQLSLPEPDEAAAEIPRKVPVKWAPSKPDAAVLSETSASLAQQKAARLSRRKD